MLKIIWILISLFLITIILLRLPQQSAGLASFATKSGVLGSPNSAYRFLNILTTICIFIYFGLAILFNLS